MNFNMSPKGKTFSNLNGYYCPKSSFRKNVSH